MPPAWVLIMGAACIVICVYMLPRQHTRWLVSMFVTSDAAKLLGATAATVAFGVVLYTAYQIHVDLQDRGDERDERNADREARDLDRLLRPSGGDIGKGAALTAMFRREHVHLPKDLSCKTVGIWDSYRSTCISSPEFSGIDFHLSDRSYRIITGLNFNNSDISYSNFTSTALRLFDFSHSTILETEFSGYTGANFDQSTLEYVSFKSDLSHSSFRDTVWGEADVSGSVFPIDTSKLFEKQEGRIYSWADDPPFHMGGFRSSDYNEPLADQLLSKLTFCNAPLDPNGKIIAKPKRESILKLLHQTLQVGETAWTCEAISLAKAREKYPEAYGRGTFGYWHQHAFH